jgi:hypothetical protein
VSIVSIRGTHGSGKSSIVRAIIDKYKLEERFQDRLTKKPERIGYSGESDGGSLFVVGSYHNACGGCDGIQPYSRILEIIQARLVEQHCLFEGALVSSSYGSIGHYMNEAEPECGTPIFAFLDTPLEVCLERIKARRAAKGNFEPLNPKNTTVKYDNVHRTKDQMARLGSRVRIVDIDHTRPVQQIMKLFGVTLRKEPSWQ